MRWRAVMGVGVVMATCAVLLAQGAFGARGVTSASKATKGTIALSFPNANQPVVVTLIKWAKREALRRGYKFIVADPGNDLGKQSALINTWIQEKVNAIVAVAPEPAVYEKLAAQAMSKGIAWITYAGILKHESGYLTWPHYTTGYLEGQAAAQWANKTLGGKGEVAILGFQQALWGRQRMQGAKAALKKFAPNLQIVASQDALLSPDAVKVTSTILQGHPNLNVVLGLTESAASGAYTAFVNGGHAKNDPKVFIAGGDGDPQDLGLLLSGSMFRFDAALRLRSIGNAVIDMPANVLEHKSPRKIVIQPQPLSINSAALVRQYIADWK